MKLIVSISENICWMTWRQFRPMPAIRNILIYEPWGPNSSDQTMDFIRIAIKESYRFPRVIFELAITLKPQRQLIGGCGFRMDEYQSGKGNVGYIIHPDHWNQGYATEAAKGLINFMTDNRYIVEVEATCDVLNLASQRVLEKCGLRRISRIDHHIKMKGRIRSSFLYSKSFNA